MAESRSSRSLDAVLTRDDATAAALRDHFHRSQLRKYRLGISKPDADGVAVFHRLTNGEVAADGWQDLPARRLAGAS